MRNKASKPATTTGTATRQVFTNTLDGLAQEAITAVKEAPATPPVLVDVTKFFPKRGPENPVIIEWKAPSVRGIYMVSGDAELLLKANPNWLPQQALDVSLMAACHVAPVGGSSGQFYQNIANGQPDMFSYLLIRLQNEFPLLKGTQDSAVMMELCVTYFMRHPLELEHLPAHILTELKNLADARKAASNFLK
jgi:hypothetical protein